MLLFTKKKPSEFIERSPKGIISKLEIKYKIFYLWWFAAFWFCSYSYKRNNLLNVTKMPKFLFSDIKFTQIGQSQKE